MTDISPLNTASAARRTGLVGPDASRAYDRAATEENPLRRSGDRVEVSDVALYLQRLRDMPEVRQDLVDRVRQEIESGQYETPEKLDAAVGELLQDLNTLE